MREYNLAVILKSVSGIAYNTYTHTRIIIGL